MKPPSFITAALMVPTRTSATTRRPSIRRARLWTGFLAFAAIVLGPQPAPAAVTETWVQRYSNVVSVTDWGAKVVRDATGDIIVTGTTFGGLSGGDLLTIKYSGADGSLLWRQRYNSPENGDDRASALAVDGGGNVVVTGISGTTFGRDFYTAKYAAADGALLWERRYNHDWAIAATVDGSGNVVLAGTSGGDYYTAKYAAANGALLWEKRYNGPANGHDGANAAAVDGSGNVVVTGSSGGDYYTAKYAAADGALLWEKRYSDPANSGGASAVAMDGSGNVVVTGTSSDGTNSGTDYYTAKYAAGDGALLWEKRYRGRGDAYDQANALVVDGSGNVVVTGSLSTVKYAAADGAQLWEKRDTGGGAVAVDGSGNVVVTGSSGTRPDFDYCTSKFAAADGALLWEQRYNGPANNGDEASAVAVDDSGNVVVTGTSGLRYSSDDSEGGDYYTAKYAAADGALLWEQRYNGSAPTYASAQAVAVDASGNVAVTGAAHNSYNGDYYTAKYAAANGALLWEKRYNGPANAHDWASAIAVDGTGNVVVTGTSGSFDYYTAKYAAANGALLWEKRSNGPADEYASALALDGSGNVVVTGSSYSVFNHNTDYYTAKYAAANGALLWEKRYNGPAMAYDKPSAVAVDGSGNVVVTGASGSRYSDYYTAKYAAADGALLWEKRYDGPAKRDDQATGVAVDGSGNVVVTGFSFNGMHGGDFYTAKYAAADGALLWEQRYNGPGNSYDYASALAVDGSGNVVVTGSSSNTNNYDYYTAKYAAADGALLWEKRYDGPANGSDQPGAVAVDGSGNVVVTGNSAISGFDPFGNTIYDCYTAKYAVADGGLLWEKRSSGPASVGDSSHCLALRPDGMVVVTGTAYGGYATVVYREVPGAVSVDLLPDGIRLRFTGVPGRSYNIERTPALTGPWSTINTQMAPASSLLEYVDTLPHPRSGFYRIVQP